MTQSSVVRFGLLEVQAASADVSIFFASGAAPVYETLPVTVPSSFFEREVYPPVPAPPALSFPPVVPPPPHDDARDSRLSVAINPSHNSERLIHIYFFSP